MIVFNWYKGKKCCTYEQRHRTVIKRSNVSGHSWNEHIPLKTWDIISPMVGVIQSVRSEKKAKELCEYYGHFDVYIPLQQRELDYLIERGEV